MSARHSNRRRSVGQAFEPDADATNVGLESLTYGSAARASRLLVILALCLAVVTTCGCRRPLASSPDPAAKASDASVASSNVVHPKKQDVRRTIQRPGYNIEPYERTPLYVKLAAYVRKWNFDIGDRVRKDDVMAELFIPEMAVELKQKKAAVRQAAAEIQLAKAAVERAQAEQDRAKSQYERMAAVGRSGVLDKEQVDETRLGFEAAQAGLAKARAEVSVAEARLEAATTDQEHIETLLQYTKVLAPFDGVVTHRNVNTGDFVQPAAFGKEASLYVVERINPVRVFVNIAELDAVWVRDGDVAAIRSQSLPGQEFRGNVTRTAGTLHPANRTLHTEIDLPNADNKLMPGMYVTATIFAERKNVWALPIAAVVTDDDQTFCYRLDNGKAVPMAVQTGLRGDELVEVLKKQTKIPTAAAASGWEDFTGEERIVANAAALPAIGSASEAGTDKKAKP